MASDNRYAAMRFRQAAEQAREYLDEDLWFSAMVWAAEALYQLGDLRGAFEAIVTARSEEPNGAEFAHWLCRKLQFKIGLAWEPKASKLDAILAELEQFYPRGNFRKHDLHVCRAELALARGMYANALSHFEHAIADFEHSAPGATKCGFSYLAVGCCMALRRFAAAEDWIIAIVDKSESDRGFNTTIARYQAGCRLTLARARCVSQGRLDQLLREFDDVCRDTDEAGLRNHLLKERVRVGLLDTHSGDPARSVHPSRNACREFSARGLDWQYQFDRALTVLDYRLACLRFAAGVGPVDDEFDKAARSLGKLLLAERQDFDQRLRHARSALRRAHIRATKLDEMLDCDWRTREVDARAEWIGAIEVAAAP